ncbi:hypothetical protein Hanom_Chr15g01395571 [Helianthus anomalus]
MQPTNLKEIYIYLGLGSYLQFSVQIEEDGSVLRLLHHLLTTTSQLRPPWPPLATVISASGHHDHQKRWYCRQSQLGYYPASFSASLSPSISR